MVGEIETPDTTGAVFWIVTVAVSVPVSPNVSKVVALQATISVARNSAARVEDKVLVDVAVTVAPFTVHSNDVVVVSLSSSAEVAVQVKVLLALGLVGVRVTDTLGALFVSVIDPLEESVPPSESVAVALQVSTSPLEAVDELKVTAADEPIVEPLVVFTHE